jgi:hypothetical protein
MGAQKAGQYGAGACWSTWVGSVARVCAPCSHGSISSTSAPCCAAVLRALMYCSAGGSTRTWTWRSPSDSRLTARTTPSKVTQGATSVKRSGRRTRCRHGSEHAATPEVGERVGVSVGGGRVAVGVVAVIAVGVTAGAPVGSVPAVTGGRQPVRIIARSPSATRKRPHRAGPAQFTLTPGSGGHSRHTTAAQNTAPSRTRTLALAVLCVRLGAT